MGKIAAIKLVESYVVILIILIAGVTIFGTFASYFDPRNHDIIPFIGLLLPLLLIINIIGCIYTIITRRFILSFIITVAFIIGLSGAGYKLDNIFKTATIPFKGKSIKVMTINMGENQINHENPGNLERIVEFIKTENIDILCIQEYPTDKETDSSLLKRLNFMPFYTFTDNNNQYLRVAIFSKLPINDVKHFLFRNSNNSAISANLSIDNEIIRLICAHLQTTSLNQMHINSVYGISGTIHHAITKMSDNQKLRAEQADIIRDEINSSHLPIIFCGDMNDTPASYTYRQVSSNMTDGFNECSCGIGYTYRGLFKLFRIDYILYSKDFSGLEYYSPEQSFSDHNPVIMNLELH